MLTKEINILHMIGHHKHIVSLKEVLHAPLRVYMVFGEAPFGHARFLPLYVPVSPSQVNQLWLVYRWSHYPG